MKGWLPAAIRLLEHTARATHTGFCKADEFLQNSVILGLLLAFLLPRLILLIILTRLLILRPLLRLLALLRLVALLRCLIVGIGLTRPLGVSGCGGVIGDLRAMGGLIHALLRL
ncbi:hypothetical protein MYCSP_04755 [Mycobacteroides saopaulense]|nr:hypothetical protein MYCSP_04755 [Mycobacteroides saopaulense]